MTAGNAAKVAANNRRQLDQAGRNLGKALEAGRRGALLALPTVGQLVVNEVKRLMSQPGRGRTYVIYDARTPGGRLHTASAPGDPPAVDTGLLRSSYSWRTGMAKLGGFVEVGSPVEYAPHLEFGTSKMAARPALRPAIQRVKPMIRTMFVQKIATTQSGVVARLRVVGAGILRGV